MLNQEVSDGPKSNGSENEETLEDQNASKPEQSKDAEMGDHSVTGSSKDTLSSADSTTCIDFVTLADVSGGEFISGDVVTICSLNSKDGMESGGCEKAVGGILMDVIAQHGFVCLTLKTGYSESTHYRKNILKVGSLIKSHNGVSATIAELDAEWHRNQTWAQQTEHSGVNVRCKKKTTLGDASASSDEHKNDEGENGVVWGWLPAGNSNSKISNTSSIWRVVLDSDSDSAQQTVDLTIAEVLEARERYTVWKEGSGQLCSARFMSTCISLIIPSLHSIRIHTLCH
jgi:hypothetical protein